LESLGSELFELEGNVYERVTCRYIPLNLFFFNVTDLKRSDFFTSLEKFPPDDPSRFIAYMYSWQQPGMEKIFHVLGLRGPADTDMNFLASHATHEKEDGGNPFTMERDWSPAPPLPDRVVPQPKDIHDRFGGDPITINLEGKILKQNLFVGGLENQSFHRPHVDAVLNLGEKPSRWIKDNIQHSNDRTVQKGEGAAGMSVAEIREEAEWVIHRLKKGERVLVHCVAGMNRSTTVCCAVLILLEGLSAGDALKRVREGHPWAKPDSYHWLGLRWLEKNQKG
jgi:hypothetical protein